ncbi:MAG: AgmX/PglI C-terminal domain-containing protein [Pseudomonadales bacterium]
MIATITPWDISAADRKFQRVLAYSLLAGLLSSLAVSLVPLPEPGVNEEPVPPRLAEIILPPPKPIQPPEIKRPKVKPPEVVEAKPKPKPKPKPEPAVVAEKPQTVKQAQEKARVAGLLAFQDQLQAMRDQMDATQLNDTSALVRGSGEAAKLERAVLTSSAATARKASVNTAALSQETGGIAMTGRETTIVEAVETEVAESGAMRLVKPELSGVRSIEEVRRVFDANKGAIFSIYNRALRKDPTLLGKVVLELVIQPDGTVSACEVLASELQSDELVARVVRRVQLFNFGEKDVAVTRISYPVHFLPS